MKKIVTVLSIVCIAFASCKKDKGVDCSAAINKVTKAGQAFGTDQTTQNCEAYKAALQEYINSSCFTGLSQQQKESYNESINSLNCNPE